MSTKKELNIPIEKQQGFIAEFEKIRPVYIEFAKLLESILNKAVGSLSILAIVQARPKGVVSFSNKIILKDKYQNPLADMTDLCGARVIVHFQSQVEKVCNFIKENFEIDEVNSLDLKSKLKVNEFGYRSVHYIVSPKKDAILDIPVDDKFKNLKAEIQVRTLAEHVWADISHDRIYKTDLNIPDEWKRVAARLSAMLENADNEFASMSAVIDSLANIYELQIEACKADNEILKLKTLISVLQNNPGECIRNSLKLSAIYRAKDAFADAVELLKPLIDTKVYDIILRERLRFEYGVVLAMACNCEINSARYFEAIKIINQTLNAFDKLPDDIREENREALSYIYYRAGKLLQRNVEETGRVAELFTVAHNIMPENPLYMVSLIESIILNNQNLAGYNITLFTSNISGAISKLEELIDIGIKRVPAFFTIGHCYLFLKNEAGCISAYANAVETILCGKYLNSRADIIAEIALIGKLKSCNPKLSEQVKLYLNMAMYLISDENERERYLNSLNQFRLKNEHVKTPVVIVAGGASKMDISKLDDYASYMKEIMHGFKGTIISGGTTAGIPGLVGEVKAEIQKNTHVQFDLEAYLPAVLPKDAVKSPYYDRFFETQAETFSALDILVYWTDLICNGIEPKDVILIGIDGGIIATLEYKIALSLGAKVALLAYSGRAVSDFLQDKAWKNHRNLLQLPNDPHTGWALVNQFADTILSKQEIETLAPVAHEFYRMKRLQELNPKAEDINKYKVLMPWDKLDPSLQYSNLQQVAFYEHILKRVGLSIRKADNPVLYNIKDHLNEIKHDDEKTEYDFLANLEHARWNAERLLDGWKYGPDKDIAKKLNPCIIAWDELDDKTKTYDYDPIDNIPVLLAKIGYEVFKAKW
jgi:ppGpp synthetase/RelA/SpoT-type nucleotidyltranferase